jgi:N-acetylglucosamine kinase-like BadF-type ATPase
MASSIALGIDAGGSQSRWALAGPQQHMLAEGSMPSFSAVELASDAGQHRISAILENLAREVSANGPVTAVHAGITGLGELQSRTTQVLQTLLFQHFNLAAGAVTLSNDIELACRAAFEPGQGYLVYAGTGSMAGFVDVDGQFHRAGGRGGILDDGGSGYWLTVAALRQIWRAEDEAPGCWVDSPLAVAMFDAIGGSDWALSRQLVYGASRGEIGQLALAVAAAADRDPVARRILHDAGCELARLANAMTTRFGVRPLALAGRVPALHPLIEASMRKHLLPTCNLQRVNLQAHHAAARIASRKVAP